MASMQVSAPSLACSDPSMVTAGKFLQAFHFGCHPNCSSRAQSHSETQRKITRSIVSISLSHTYRLLSLQWLTTVPSSIMLSVPPLGLSILAKPRPSHVRQSRRLSISECASIVRPQKRYINSSKRPRIIMGGSSSCTRRSTILLLGNVVES